LVQGGDEEKFKLVVEANAVLSDPHKRERYDMGEDSDDERMGGHGGGFGHGMSQVCPFAAIVSYLFAKHCTLRMIWLNFLLSSMVEGSAVAVVVVDSVVGGSAEDSQAGDDRRSISAEMPCICFKVYIYLPCCRHTSSTAIYLFCPVPIVIIERIDERPPSLLPSFHLKSFLNMQVDTALTMLSLTHSQFAPLLTNKPSSNPAANRSELPASRFLIQISSPT
jgi:hypothetical protein